MVKKVIIIGAGPAGLTAAYELLTHSKDFQVIVLEETDSFGGISKTVNYKGNRMDMGGIAFSVKFQKLMYGGRRCCRCRERHLMMIKFLEGK